MPSISCTPSRTSGVAPLGIVFDATGTTGDTAKPFHDLDYSWHFGDVDSDWSNGVPNCSKNLTRGAVSAHVYETSGTYTWQLFVHDGTNLVGTSGTITVTDPDVVFASTTVCISNDTDHTGSPAGATLVNNVSDFDAELATQIAAGKRRILWKKDDTFTSSAAGTVNVAGAVLIGAYGSGALPVVNGSTADILAPGALADDVRLMDLELVGTGLDTSGAGVSFGSSASGTTILRLTIRETGFGIVSTGTTVQTNTVLQENTIRDYHGSGSNAFWGRLATSAVLGNIMGPSLGEHVFRMQRGKKVVVSFNTFQEPNETASGVKAAVQVRADAFATTADDTELVLFSANKIIQSVNSQLMAGFNPSSGAVDARIYDYIIEGNWFVTAAFTGAPTTDALLVTGQRGTIRNNVFELSGPTTGTRIGVHVVLYGVEPVPDDINVYNNTAFASTAGGTAYGVFVGAGATNTIVKNNLAWFDLATGSPKCLLDSGTGTVSSNNSTDLQTTGTDPLFDGPLTSPVGFRIGVSSYATNGGVSIFPPTMDDFLNGYDSLGNARIGAFVPAANFASFNAIAEAATGTTPGGVKRKRKLRIYPDGRRAFATEQEAVDALFLYYHEQKLKPKEAEVLGLKPNRKKVIVAPSEKAEISEALAMLEDSNWKTRRQEEEWLILYH